MGEINLEDVIAKAMKKVGSVDSGHDKLKWNAIPVEGSSLVEAECPNCGKHGFVEPIVKEKEKPVEKEVIKEVPPKGWINPNESDFSVLAPILEHHQGGNSLFTCPNCEGEAFDWFVKQPGFDKWIDKHGFRIIKK